MSLPSLLTIQSYGMVTYLGNPSTRLMEPMIVLISSNRINK